MKKLSVCLLALFLCLIWGKTAFPASAAGYSQGWDSAGSLAGWSPIVTTRLTQVDTGGNPDGYLEVKLAADPWGATSLFTELAEVTRFSADNTWTISVDLRNLGDNVITDVQLRFRYLNCMYNGWHYRLPYDVSAMKDWTTVSVTFDPSWTDEQAVRHGWAQESSAPSWKETATNAYWTGLGFRSGPGSFSVGVDNFRLEAGNRLLLPPVAEAGGNQTVHAGELATLDGSGSSDPGGYTPLAFRWTVLSQPPGASVALSDPQAVNPSFRPAVEGTYVLSLEVVNSAGLSSPADTVEVSTFNTAPVAEAGPDRFVFAPMTKVALDGSQSYDPDGDPVSFTWYLKVKPEGSKSVIYQQTKDSPAFIVPDVVGSYVALLGVSDGWSTGYDTVTIDFGNLKPVADGGASRSVDVGTAVTLDGTASNDPNGDPISYSWAFTSKPVGSSAELAGATTATPSFTPDRDGAYVVQLVVGDGDLKSDPATVQIQAVATPTAATVMSAALQLEVQAFPPASFQNINMQNALTNKINAVIANVDAGNYGLALDQLRSDILKKTDGCAASNPALPDKNDWIKSCTEQNVLYPYLLDLVSVVEKLQLP
jgi:hypothetical protein